MKKRSIARYLRLLTIVFASLGMTLNNAAFVSFVPAGADAAVLNTSSPSAPTVVTDAGTCDAYVSSNTTSKTCSTGGGAIVSYLGAQDTAADNQASSGTGTFNPFVRLQGDTTEQGYNTDATGKGVEFDTKSGNWTHSILVSQIPVVTNVPGHPGTPYWELFADINETNSTTTTPVSLNKVQVYFTSDPAITGYSGTTKSFSSSSSTLEYDFAGDILINDVNAGSGRADLRYRIPTTGITIPANCGYGDTGCTTYFVLYTQWGTSTVQPAPGGAITSATYNSDGGFEEWKTKVYPTLQIVKKTTGGDGTFGFTVAGPSAPLSPAPTVTTSGGTGQTILYIIDAGTYAITENALAAGWSFTNATCSLNGASATAYTPGANLVIGSTDHLVCTFNNAAAAPSLTLAKHVVNDNGGTANASAWSLSAAGSSGSFSGTGSPATGTTASLTHAVTAGVQYTLSESGGPATGYGSTGTWSCTGGGTFTSPDKITLAIGESATCTITNDDVAPKLHLRKTVVNDNGGTATAADFTLTANGTGTNDLSGTSPVDSGAGLQADTWALSETGTAGYTGTWACVGGTQNGNNITVGIGGEATCTVTNDDDPPSLTLVKNVVNNNGGTAVATDWTLNAAGPTTINGAGGVTSGAGFSAGTYTLSENPGPDGYSASAWVCTGTGSQDGSEITLALGQSATCTITNTDIAAHLIVIKHVINDNGGTHVASDWTMSITGVTASGGTTFAGAESPGTDKTLTSVGSYSVSESSTPTGYGATYSADCSGTIALGETKTCTITNDDAAPGLHLRKIVVNDNGGAAHDTDWTLTATGPTTMSGTTPVDSGSTFVAGTYTLSESGGPSGYTASAWVCDGGAQEGNAVSVAQGASVTCTITNNDNAPTLHLRKVVSGGTAKSTDWTLTATGPTNLSGSTPVDSGAGFAAGTYALAETGPSGYSASAWVCDGGTQNGASITLGLGQSATCTITNTFVVVPPPPPQVGTLQVIKYNDANGNGIRDNGETTLSGVTFTVKLGTSTIGTLTTDANGQATLSGLGAGLYTVVETVQQGWHSTDPGGATPTKNANVSTGTTATVLFGNQQTLIPPTTIGGAIVVTKYEDANRNKQFDAGEATLAGWSFTIKDSHGATVTTIVTGANGTAAAADLPAGTYTITEIVQTGWSSTDPGGSTPSKTVTIAAGQTLGVGFGNAKLQLPSTSTAGGDPSTTLRIVLLGLALLCLALQWWMTRALRGSASHAAAHSTVSDDRS